MRKSLSAFAGKQLIPLYREVMADGGLEPHINQPEAQRHA
jgi:hypothetical protein